MFGEEILSKFSPRVITSVAACLFLISLAASGYEVYQYYLSQQAVDELPVAELPTRRDPKYNIRQIVAAHLFGDSQPVRSQPAAVAPQTKLNLELQGVLAASNPDMARAIIAVGSKEGKLYGVGTEIEGTNASIKTIQGNVVILSRGGGTESLSMPKELVSSDAEDYFFIPEEYSNPATAAGGALAPRAIKAPSASVFERLDDQIAKEDEAAAGDTE